MIQAIKITHLKDKLLKMERCTQCRQTMARMNDLMEKGIKFTVEFDGKCIRIDEVDN
jgi:hypothetical protein